MAGTRRKIEAVENTCQIIQVLRDRGSAGITEISEELDFSKSAVHGHLATLRSQGLVVKEDHSYSLSLQFLDLAEHAKNEVTDYGIVKEEVRDLAIEASELAHFATEERGQVVYVCKESGESAISSASRVGMRKPMHATALGKAILAELPESAVDAILDRHGLSKETEQTITDRDRFREELAEVRERGYAVDDEESSPGIRCIGMAVTTPESDVLGALSVTGPSKRMTDNRIEYELSEKLAEAVNVIEVNSMYS